MDPEVENGRAKKQSRESDSENAPLLDHSGWERDDAKNGERRPNMSEKMRNYFARIGQWLLKNRMVASLIALLLGGFIALCIYFGGMFSNARPFQ